MDSIETLHQSWQTHTQQKIHIRACERLLFDLAQTDVTADDVRCVVQYLQRLNKTSDFKFQIQFHRVMELERFHSLLGEARAKERNRRPAPTPKEQVQQQYAQVLDPEQTSTMTQQPMRHISEVVKHLGETK